MPVTVFAPSNAALAAANLDPRDTATATAVLENHILLGTRLPTPVAAQETEETLAGGGRV